MGHNKIIIIVESSRINSNILLLIRRVDISVISTGDILALILNNNKNVPLSKSGRSILFTCAICNNDLQNIYQIQLGWPTYIKNRPDARGIEMQELNIYDLSF